MSNNHARLHGTITRRNHQRGTIAASNGNEYIFERSGDLAQEIAWRDVREGTQVSFVEGGDATLQLPRATDVRPVSPEEGFA